MIPISPGLSRSANLTAGEQTHPNTLMSRALHISAIGVKDCEAFGLIHSTEYDHQNAVQRRDSKWFLRIAQAWLQAPLGERGSMLSTLRISGAGGEKSREILCCHWKLKGLNARILKTGSRDKSSSPQR